MLKARPHAPNTAFCIRILFFSKTLEAYAEADCGEVAVDQSVVLAIKEVGVAQAGVVLVGIVGIHPEADRLGVLHEVRAVTLNVVRPGDVRAQVDTGNHVAVVQGGTQTVAPGEVGIETIVLAPARTVRVICNIGIAATIGVGALTKQRVATELGFPVAATDATDIVRTDLTDQCQAARTHNAINKMDRAHGRLPELLALIALEIIADLNLAGLVAVRIISSASP